MPSNYYEQQFEIGPNGEKFVLLQVDSPYLLCETVGKKTDQKYLMNFDDHSKKIFKSKCEGDESFVQKGNEQMEWIKRTMEEQLKDEKIIWKASNMHHPMFGLHNDYQSLIDDYKPLLEAHGYEIYFNGHEHNQIYGYTSNGNDQGPEKRKEQIPYGKKDCWESIEWFPEGGPEKKDRKVEASKGDNIHLFTLGASGRETSKLCQSKYDTSQGNYKYAENSMNGFAFITVTPEEFNIQYKGIQNKNPVPEPFFKKFVLEAIGLERVMPDKMQQVIFDDNYKSKSIKYDIKQLFEVSIKNEQLGSQMNIPFLH